MGFGAGGSSTNHAVSAAGAEEGLSGRQVSAEQRRLDTSESAGADARSFREPPIHQPRWGDRGQHLVELARSPGASVRMVERAIRQAHPELSVLRPRQLA